MTECTKDGITFSSQGRQQVVADFRGGDISSDAGVLLLREAERGLGLIERLSAAINDPRDPARITHEQRTLLNQRVMAIALGYEDLNDHTALRNDTLLKLSAGATDAMGSSPTLCRLENRVDRVSMWAMAGVLVDTFITSFGKKAPEQLILDFDATDDPTHGKQEGRFFHGYYDHYCFLPLYVFCGDKMLAAYLRPSNIDSAKHSWAILALLVKRLRAAWPKVRIVVRADSGFCRWRMLRWCDTHSVNYIVGLARNSRLESAAAALMLKAAQGYEKTKEKQRLSSDIQYAAATWDRTRRVIAKAEHMDDGPNPRFIVTNLTGDAQELYDTVYCARGEMENRIKEQVAAATTVRGSHQLSQVRGQSVPGSAQCRGVRAGGTHTQRRLAWHRACLCTGDPDQAGAVQDRSPGADLGTPDCHSPGDRHALFSSSPQSD